MKAQVKKTTYILVALLFMIPGTMQAETYTAKATATLLAAITIDELSGLNFGSIILKGTTDSTITLGYANDATSSGTSTPGSGALTGKYQISGNPSTPVNISVAKVSDLSNGTDTLTTTFTTNSTNVTLDSSGNFVVSVGGTIAVNTNKSTNAVYTGQFNVIANY